MNFDIRHNDDLLTGTTLIVRIKENEVDEKALKTIQADRPEFLLPFHHYYIDGQVQFVYQIGMFCNLKYISGNRTAKEYAQLWISILRPLLDCEDWFMQASSFLLDIDYLYYDKDRKSCCFVYIPSIHNASDHSALKEMAADVSEIITVDDACLENKILRAIMKNFEPKDLLKTLRLAMADSIRTSGKGVFPAEKESESTFVPNTTDNIIREKALVQAAPEPFAERVEQVQSLLPKPEKQKEMPFDQGEIIIDIPEKSMRKTKDKSSSKDKQTKAKERERRMNRLFEELFGKKKDPPPQLAQTTCASHNTGTFTHEKTAADTGDLPAENNIVKMPQSEIARQTNIQGTMYNDSTESITIGTGGALLRNIGKLQLPLIIEVEIEEGKIFGIGRYDAALGKKQSSFEFDKKTKAISRRHCVIKRDPDGYNIIDLASSAGTFVDGERLPPNTPIRLANACKVSFGNAGADYIWEQ